MKTQKVLSHNTEEKLEFDNYISEQCHICGVPLLHTKDIRVDIETDQYLCIECAEYHNIKTSECREY